MDYRRSLVWRLRGILLVPLLVACAGGAPAPTSLPASEGAESPAPIIGNTKATPEPEMGALRLPESTQVGASEAMPTPDTGPLVYAKAEPPAVANAEAARRYRGTTITYYGGRMDFGQELDEILVQKFSQETGITVEVASRPRVTTDTYTTYERLFKERSPEIDVLNINAVWTGPLASHLVDLGGLLGAEARRHHTLFVENNRVGGRLVAMPYYGEFGVLYYRTDLLEKYGFDAPPATWDQLEQQAATIMHGERPHNNNFVGFVFQGNAYEGLTSNALEWIASNGGGALLEKGRFTFNNPQAIESLEQARSWVGTITPEAVTGYIEEDVRNVFQGGNAAFARNWLYAYPMGNSEGSAIKGRFEIAPLPAAPGQRSVSAVGGWQLAVSAYSQNQAAAVELVRYMTNPEVQLYRAVVGGYVPTMPDLMIHSDVLQAMPYLARLEQVRGLTRPSSELGERYREASRLFAQGVNDILRGQEAAQVVPQLEQQLQQLIP